MLFTDCASFEFPPDSLFCSSTSLGCYFESEACDGINDCPGGVDEIAEVSCAIDGGFVDNTCQNGGTREQNLPNFCSCPTRFSGDYCEVDNGQ